MKLYRLNNFITYSVITYLLLTFTANAATKLQNNEVCFFGNFSSVLFKSQTNNVAIDPQNDLDIAYKITPGQPFEGVVNNTASSNCFTVKAGRKNSALVAIWAQNTAKHALNTTNFNAITPVGRVFDSSEKYSLKEANFAIFGTLILKQKIGKEQYKKLICPNVTLGQYGDSGANIWFVYGKPYSTFNAGTNSLKLNGLEINCYDADNNEETSIIIKHNVLPPRGGKGAMKIVDDEINTDNEVVNINSTINDFELEYK